MLIPMKGCLLVEPEFRQDKTDSGFYLKYENKLQAAPNIGVVTHVAGDIKDINPGDRIIFKPPATMNPQGFKYDGKSYIYLEYDQVIAKIEGKA